MSIQVFDQDPSGRVGRISGLIIHALETMVEAADPRAISLKLKAVSTIIPFAISLEGAGQQAMLDVAVRAFQFSPTPWRAMWFYTEWCIKTLFKEPSAPSLNRAIALVSPYRHSYGWEEDDVATWATAVLAVPYTEEVGQRVVDATLQIASSDSLRPHIPIGVWALFKKRPSLQPTCQGLLDGASPKVIGHVRGLGDLEILKSFLLLVWHEWVPLFNNGFDVMEMSIREDFCGAGMGRHRDDLLQRVDFVLGELGRGSEYLRRLPQWCFWRTKPIHETRQRYGWLKDVLLEVEREAAVRDLNRTSPKLFPLQRADGPL